MLNNYVLLCAYKSLKPMQLRTKNAELLLVTAFAISVTSPRLHGYPGRLLPVTAEFPAPDILALNWEENGN